MFREMRRKGQALSSEECREILEKGSCGVLALDGDDGYPYAVPISYVFSGGKLYFHCAKSGHKLDALRRNPKGSFCVVGQDLVVPERYTTCYHSVIVFGTLRELTEEGEARAAVTALAVKYAPSDAPARREREIEREWGRFCMVEMTPAHITGKEGIELVRRRERGK